MQERVNIALPVAVKDILTKIHQAGWEAYAVGGCVRDSLLGRQPQDWDITTSALPAQIKGLFARTIDTGIVHGTVTVMVDHVGYEVTTYRIDGEYEDGRHPKEVSFTASLLEDLKRRDFTINAMAYNEEEGLIDAFDGMGDMQRKIIRCVGEARCRFEEDALRMMRAVRFSAQLGYEIEEETTQAIKALAPTLRKVSAERIQMELVKLLTSDHPDYLRKAFETGLTAVFFPEFDEAMKTPQNHPHHCYCVGEHILHSLTHINPERVLRLTMLFHDIGKPPTRRRDEAGIDHFYGHSTVGERMAKEIMKRLRMDNATIEKVCILVKYHDLRPEPAKRAVKRAVVKVSRELFGLFLQVQQADLLAQGNYLREEKQKTLNRVKQIYEEILEEGDCLTLKELALSGKDLLEAGMKSGKAMGDTLKRLLEHVLENPQDNKKEILLKLAEQWKEN
ncbi:MAG: CCA tRNA nucleotidyltransferase [Lachnospiraceae bacterium]|nr:CCA tRNA nucleotidyltransferase [Lachnospiraceae bacterium]